MYTQYHCSLCHTAFKHKKLAEEHVKGHLPGMAEGPDVGLRPKNGNTEREASMNEEIIKSLQQPLNPALVKQRKGRGNQMLDYIEGYVAIDQANRIFGYDGWHLTTMAIDYHETADARFYTAKVYVDAFSVHRTDVGFCEVSANTDGKYTGDAHDTAMKGAVTDAMKRAMRTFGAQFGNSLYSKEPAAALNDQQPRSNRPLRGSMRTGPRPLPTLPNAPSAARTSSPAIRCAIPATSRQGQRNEQRPYESR